MREITLSDVSSPNAPLSWGIEHNDLVFVSGQAAFDLDTGEIVGDGVQEETAQTLENIEYVLNEVDGTLDDIIKTTVFLTDVDDFEEMNEVYREYFDDPYPARSAIEVSNLAADIVVEIEAIARLD